MSLINRFALGLLLIAMLVACSPEIIDPTAEPTPTLDSPTSTRTPMPTRTPPPKPAEGQATVENIQILMLESFPLQVHVLAKGYLPDACTSIDQITQEQEGELFRVAITTARPAGKACADVIVEFEETIALEVYGLPAGEYQVDVNSVRDSFVFTVDNVPAEEPAGATISGDALVDSLEIVGFEAGPARINIRVQGHVSDGCTAIGEALQTVDGDVIKVNLTTTRPADAMCITVMTPYEHLIPLEVEGLPAGKYTVDVNGVRLSIELPYSPDTSGVRRAIS